MEPLSFRRAEPCDVEPVAELIAEAGRELGPRMFFADDAAFVEEHLERRGWIELAEADGALAGCLLVRVPGEDADNLGREIGLAGDGLASVAHMETIVVGREARGRGVARSLLERALGEARARGFRRATCTIHPDNLASHRTFEQAGFSVAGRMLKHGGIPRDVMLLELEGHEGGEGAAPA